MARIRYIKPEFFTDADIGDLAPLDRLFFAGLWCYADKAGRLVYRPRELSVKIMPWDQPFDAEATITRLVERGFLILYESEGESYIQVRTWDKHQRPHHTERATVNPPCSNGEVTVKPRLGRGMGKGMGKGTGKTGKGKKGTETEQALSGKPPDETVFPSELDTPAFREAWKEWAAHRKDLRLKAYKPRGEKAKLTALSKIGSDRAVAAIQFSMGQNYNGIFEPQGKQNSTDDPRGNLSAVETFKDMIRGEK